MYSIIFDENSRMWTDDSELNRFFIQVQQNWANDCLKVQGHLFLNEVYDRFAVKRSGVGATSGWLMNGEGSSNYVDFKLMINEDDNSIIIDFNPDGIIYDKI